MTVRPCTGRVVEGPRLSVVATRVSKAEWNMLISPARDAMRSTGSPTSAVGQALRGPFPVAVALTTVAMFTAPAAHADDGWVAVANSPNREQQDWAYGPDRATAEAAALAQCTLLQQATDCRVLAASPACIATAWDASQPLNQIYANVADGPDAAMGGAIAAAGPYANDVQVRCTWWPRDPPGPLPPDTTLT